MANTTTSPETEQTIEGYRMARDIGIIFAVMFIIMILGGVIIDYMRW